MAGTAKYQDIVQRIVDLVGGTSNIALVAHCVTRLRFTVKDKSLVKQKEVDALSGVVGSQWLGDQFQVIVGTGVEEVYHELCATYHLAEEKPIDENLDGDLAPATTNGKLTPAAIGNAILGYISPTMTGIIPIMMGACLCKTLGALLGPGILNVISDTSDLYIVLDFLYDAFFYFIPLFLGYSAARTLNINPTYGIYLGALIMVPDFMALVGARESISVFGIPVPVASYAQTFLPVILGVWVMSFVYRLLNTYIPEVLKSIFVPFLTIMVMTPIMFAVCAPLGTYVGNVIGGFFISMSQANVAIRLVGAILLAVLMPYMVLGGMHGALLNFALMTFTENGFETLILPIMLAYNFAVFGVSFGAIFKLKKPENKTAVTGYFATGILGSVTEPCLYGVIVKYRQTMVSLLIASVFIGIIVGVFTPVYYVMSSATIFTFWVPWVQGGTANFIEGIVLMVGAFAVGAIAALFARYDES